jgi:hypothetical protein
MYGRTETEQSHPLAGFNTGYAKTTKTDDASAQKRSSMQIIQSCGKREYEVSTRDCIFSISSVNGVAGEGRGVAKVFKTVPAIPALPIDATDPGNSNARTQGKLRRLSLDDLTHDLMTRS